MPAPAIVPDRGDEQEVDRPFGAAIGALTDGSVFPSPFDLSTSAALAANGTTGQPERRRRMHVQVHEVLPGNPPLRREIIDCEVDWVVGAALLVETGIDLEEEEEGNGETDH